MSGEQERRAVRRRTRSRKQERLAAKQRTRIQQQDIQQDKKHHIHLSQMWDGRLNEEAIRSTPEELIRLADNEAEPSGEDTEEPALDDGMAMETAAQKEDPDVLSPADSPFDQLTEEDSTLDSAAFGSVDLFPMDSVAETWDQASKSRMVLELIIEEIAVSEQQPGEPSLFVYSPLSAAVLNMRGTSENARGLRRRVLERAALLHALGRRLSLAEPDYFRMTPRGDLPERPVIDSTEFAGLLKIPVASGKNVSTNLAPPDRTKRVRTPSGQQSPLKDFVLDRRDVEHVAEENLSPTDPWLLFYLAEESLNIEIDGAVAVYSEAELTASIQRHFLGAKQTKVAKLRDSRLRMHVRPSRERKAIYGAQQAAWSSEDLPDAIFYHDAPEQSPALRDDWYRRMDRSLTRAVKLAHERDEAAIESRLFMWLEAVRRLR